MATELHKIGILGSEDRQHLPESCVAP